MSDSAAILFLLVLFLVGVGGVLVELDKLTRRRRR